MKKTCFILFFFTGIFFTANSQNDNNLNNKKTMEKLNIDSIKNKFSANRQYIKNGKLCEATNFRTSSLKEYNELKEDTLITIEENRNRHYEDLNTYTKVVRNINSNFRNVKTYNINTLVLKREATYLGNYLDNTGVARGLEIGISKEYDENGFLVKEIDNDKNYLFSINMLIEKMKADYNIDLSVCSQEQPVLTWRFYENSRWVYCIRILLSTDLIGSKRFIKLDGETGEVISDKIVSLTINNPVDTSGKDGTTLEILDFKNIKDKFTPYKQEIKDGKIYTYKDYKNSYLGYMELTNDTLICMTDDGNWYRKTMRKMSTPLVNFKSYYKSNCILSSESNKFYGFYTGLGKWYDEDGCLIQVREYDGDFPFSVEMLIDKMKTEYNIDLLIPDEKQPMGIGRQYEANHWIYEITIRLSPKLSMAEQRVIQIDGSTGEVISDKIIFPTYPPGPTGGPK